MDDIIGTSLDFLLDQDVRNKEARTRMKTILPTAANTETSIIKMSTTTLCFKTEAHKELSQSMRAAKPYSIFHLTDATMNISPILDPRQRTKERAKFLKGVKFDFPVGVYTFKRSGSVGNGVVL